MARGAQDFDALGHLVAIPVVTPHIPLVHPPEIHDFGVREEGHIHRMVRMMMTDKNVGHSLRGDPSFGEWVDNEPAIRDHAGVRDDNGVLALDEHNGTRYASSAIWGGARDELA